MNNLKVLRQKSGLSQIQLAHCLNVSQQAVAKWENGVANPRADTLLEIAKIFGCTIDDLFADAAG